MPFKTILSLAMKDPVVNLPVCHALVDVFRNGSQDPGSGQRGFSNSVPANTNLAIVLRRKECGKKITFAIDNVTL